MVNTTSTTPTSSASRTEEGIEKNEVGVSNQTVAEKEKVEVGVKMVREEKKEEHAAASSEKVSEDENNRNELPSVDFPLKRGGSVGGSKSAARLRASIASIRANEHNITFSREELLADLEKKDTSGNITFQDSTTEHLGVKVSSAEVSRQASTLNSSVVDISKEQRGTMQYGREPCTVELPRFIALAKKIRADLDREVCHRFWELLEEKLSSFSTDRHIDHGHQDEFGRFQDMSTDEKQKQVVSRLHGIAPFMEFDALQMAKLLGEEEQGVTPNLVLEECLAACRGGVMRMNFGVACTRCNGNIGSHDKIALIPKSSQCNSCSQENTNDSLDRVRIRFQLDADTLYAPHLFAPCQLPKKLTTRLPTMPKVLFPTTTNSAYDYSVDLPQGKYMIVCPLADIRLRVEIMEDAAERDERLDLVLANSTISGKGNKGVAVVHGKLRVKAICDTPSVTAHIWTPDHDVSELQLPKEEIAPSYTGTDVINHPKFQEYFSGQVLGASQQFQVGSCVLCFTDLVDSTRQYTKLGDAVALQLVQDHFEMLFGTIAEEGGRVVKTIGDAVMASFTSVDRCVRATAKAMQMMLEYTADATRCPRGGHMHLKTGIHMGQSLMVPLNGVNDYFGQTVNIAARVQGKAESDEIILSEAAMNDVGTAECLEKLVTEGTLEKVFSKGFDLKGVDGTPQLTGYRVKPFTTNAILSAQEEQQQQQQDEEDGIDQGDVNTEEKEVEKSTGMVEEKSKATSQHKK